MCTHIARLKAVCTVQYTTVASLITENSKRWPVPPNVYADLAMVCTEEAILNEERSTEEEKMRILEGTFSFSFFFFFSSCQAVKQRVEAHMCIARVPENKRRA